VCVCHEDEFQKKSKVYKVWCKMSGTLFEVIFIFH
jgi:hypothetical protein